MPSCPASLTPIIYYEHTCLPSSCASAILDSPGLTHHLFISTPIFVSSLALFPDAALIVFCLCYLFADAVSVLFHVRYLLNVLLPVPALSLQRHPRDSGTTANLPREGRPPKITVQARRPLIREATKTPKKTLKELQSSTAEIGQSIGPF